MSLFIDLWHTNNNVFKKTMNGLKRNKMIFFIGIPYVLVMGLAMEVASNLSFFAGLIVMLVQSAILSDYLWIVGRIVKNKQFTLDDFKIGYKVYFRKVYISLLLIRFAYLGINVFLGFFGTVERYAYVLLTIAIVVFLNPLAEVIYQKHLQEWDGFKYSYNFTLKNWLDWFAPNIVIMLSIYFVKYITTIVINMMPIQSDSIKILIFLVIFAIIGQFFVNFGMVYRGFLFDIISNTSRKKRVFSRHLH